MKKQIKYLVVLSACLLGLQVSAHTQDSLQQQQADTYLFPVGGGKVSDNFLKDFVKNRGKDQPRILIISYASKESNVKEVSKKNVDRFKNMGYQQVESLDLSNPQEALKQVQRAEVIWMSGGGQARLRRALERAKFGIPEAIRDQYNSGKTIIGGTSAGASIQSDVMISNTKKDKDTGDRSVIMSYGLKLWPEVIIDQHFSERKRMWRLEEVVPKHPHLIGIGIDESTGVLLKNKKELTVIGSGTVTVYRATSDKKFDTIILKPGETYKMP